MLLYKTTELPSSLVPGLTCYETLAAAIAALPPSVAIHFVDPP